MKPVCPVHNLRAGYAVPYHSFHTQNACHCHVTSGDGWGWTSSWRLWGTGHTCTPSPLYGLSCVGPDLIRRGQAREWIKKNHPSHIWIKWTVYVEMCCLVHILSRVCVPVLIWEDLLTVFTLVDGFVAVLTFLFEVFSQCVKDGACTGAWILLVPPQLECWGEQLITVFTAVHLLVCTYTRKNTLV